MLFNSLEFLIFLPIVFFFYWTILSKNLTSKIALFYYQAIYFMVGGIGDIYL